MNRRQYNQARVSCHTPWQRPLSLLLALSFALLSATSPVAAEQSTEVPSPANSHVAFLDISDLNNQAVLNDDELERIRGRFSGPDQLQASNSNDIAVILWDEIKSGSSRTQQQQNGGSNNLQSNSVTYSK